MKKSLLLAGMLFLGLCASAHYTEVLFANSNDVNEEGKLPENATEMTVNYKLSFDCDAASVIFYLDEEVVKEVALEGDDLLRGEHSTTVDVSDLDANVEYLLAVKAVNNAIEVPTKVGPTYTFWSPYGIDIDKNPESPYFGRILVTESQASVNAYSSYWTSNQSEGVGPGIYAFDQYMERIPNEAGGYGFNGGVEFTSYSYTDVTGGSGGAFGPKNLKIAEDGRIFLGCLDVKNQPMYVVNPANLNEWTPFFVGEQTHTGKGAGNDWGLYTENDEWVASHSAAFDITGSGENMKLVNLSSKLGQVYSSGQYETYEYPIGAAETWGEAADWMNEVLPISMRYTQSAQTLGIAYDEDGNIWYNQYRGSPSASQPSLVHCSKNADDEWVEDYTYFEAMDRGGIQFSPDFELLAIPRATGHLSFNEVTKNASGAPELTQVMEFDGTGTINAFNAIAFDAEGDCYAVDNSKEVFIKIAMPQEETEFELEAFSFIIPVETSVSDVKTNKTIAGVQYINAAGQVSNVPFDGVNIVVTKYQDGTQSVVKVVK